MISGIWLKAMENDLTTIIMTAYIQEPWQAHMTMAALANVARYTNPDSYELILMSDSEKFPVRNEYHALKIDRYERTNGLSYTQSMNRGAKLAKGNYLCFLQNDVFVFGDWLEDLKEYILRNLADCVIPDQVPRPYQEVQSFKFMDYEEAMKFGSRDEGLLFITKEAFKKTGGFNESLTLLQARDFYERMSNNGIRQIDTVKVIISHIMAASNLNTLYKDPKKYDSMMKADSDILNV